MELHQAKKLCSAKKTLSQVKRQPAEWKKTFAKYTSDKELISDYTKSSSNPTTTKQKIQLRNGLII